MITISSSSLEYIEYKVQANVNGSIYNPTQDLVQFGFSNGAAVQPVTWYSGSWVTDTSTGNTVYKARCLVGPGGTVTLAVGNYFVWTKITDNPEIPIRQPGSLRIY